IDTRALTKHLRDKGAQNGVIYYYCHPEQSEGSSPSPQTLKIPRFARDDKLIEHLIEQARALPDMNGLDIAKTVTTEDTYTWNQTTWNPADDTYGTRGAPRAHIVVVDYGVKRNILRCLAAQGFALTVVPCTTSAEDILALKPDGIFLS